jgi:hypothetical protein
MKAPIIGLLAVALVALVPAAAPVVAHHAFAAEFDINKPITVTGAVTKLKWTNPHAFIFVGVKDDKGDTTEWGFELGTPNALLRLGWTRDAVKVGDTLTIEGYSAKDGSHYANARAIRLPDGRKLFSGTVTGESTPTQ